MPFRDDTSDDYDDDEPEELQDRAQRRRAIYRGHWATSDDSGQREPMTPAMRRMMVKDKGTR